MAMNLPPPLAEDLPDEIVLEIFLKLPVKSLVRFQCVSKPLSAAVRSPDFIASHHSLQKQNRDPQILRLFSSDYHDMKPYFITLSTDFRPTENIQMPFLDDCSYEPIVSGPCNGLLCISSDDRITLWNPATREFKHVPPSTIRRPPEIQRTSFDVVGLGFDSRSGEYKVIRFVKNYFTYEGWMDQVEIYCLNSNSWREISAPERIPNVYSTFWDLENGLCHLGKFGFDDKLIISFDMTNESFSTTALPEIGEDYFWEIVKCSDGAMTLIAYPRYVEEKVFDLWVKKDGWIKELSIGPFPGVERPLGFWKDGQLFLECNDDELMLLDVHRGEIKNLGVYAFSQTVQVILHSESLVPISGGRTEQQEHIFRQMIHH